jgi:hypothetical protein
MSEKDDDDASSEIASENNINSNSGPDKKPVKTERNAKKNKKKNDSRKSKTSLRSISQIFGPGIITGASDDDPSGIATYSQAGAKFGAWYALDGFISITYDDGCSRNVCQNRTSDW